LCSADPSCLSFLLWRQGGPVSLSACAP
jgi:hypothetical protein